MSEQVVFLGGIFGALLVFYLFYGLNGFIGRLFHDVQHAEHPAIMCHYVQQKTKE